MEKTDDWIKEGMSDKQKEGMDGIYTAAGAAAGAAAGLGVAGYAAKETLKKTLKNSGSTKHICSKKTTDSDIKDQSTTKTQGEVKAPVQHNIKEPTKITQHMPAKPAVNDNIKPTIHKTSDVKTTPQNNIKQQTATHSHSEVKAPVKHDNNKPVGASSNIGDQPKSTKPVFDFSNNMGAGSYIPKPMDPVKLPQSKADFKNSKSEPVTKQPFKDEANKQSHDLSKDTPHKDASHTTPVKNKVEPEVNIKEEVRDANLNKFKASLDKNNKVNLDEHEGGNWNGHVIKKHVLPSDNVIMDRKLNPTKYDPNQRYLKGSSSFTDKDTAERVIAEALQHNWDKVEKWMLDTDKQKLRIDYESNKVIGRGISDPDTTISDRSKVKIFLKRVENELKIETGYPVK